MDEYTIPEFQTPEFLENYDTDSIYETMRGILPEDIDSSEGSHTWNLLMPTALTLAELYEVVLPEVIQLIFPEWSYGEYLDAHALTRGMQRKAATPATGQVTITGAAWTVIPAGTMFSTPSLNDDDPSMTYVTEEEVTIPEPPASDPAPGGDEEDEDEDTPIGTITVDVVCSEPGTEGNTGEDTVIFLSSDVDGIDSVTNEAPISGGTDEETDEDLIQRIMAYDQTQGDSFVGNAADYQRWATSVAGVGSAAVVPAADGSGTVTIVLTDSNGDPASEDLCTAVYDYIMAPGDPYSRLAPINAAVNVVTPTTVQIAVKATVELAGEADITDVAALYLAALQVYMDTALADGEVKISKMGAILSSISGVNDFSNLEIGKVSGGTATYGTTNIALASTELPTITATYVTLQPGTV